jgi:hypothetical protein
MARASGTVSIPLTNTGRKYGYITWRKKHDDDMLKVFGEKNTIDLQIGDVLQKQKTIDWKHRRIGITLSLTRRLSQKVQTIRLQRVNMHRVAVSFHEISSGNAPS